MATENRTRPRFARRWLRLTMAILFLGALGLSYASWVGVELREERQLHQQPILQIGASNPETLLVKACLVELDLTRSRATLRLELSVPAGSPPRGVRLRCGDNPEVQFAPGQPFTPLTQQVSLHGSSFYYPDDSHRCILDIMSPSNSLMVEVRSECMGYALAAPRNDFLSRNRAVLSFDINRSPILKFLAQGLLALQWMVTLGCLSVTLAVLVGSRRTEATHWLWLATSLLALNLLRSQMVGAPTVGIYLDYFGFLPCVATVVGCTLVHLYCWLRDN